MTEDSSTNTSSLQPVTNHPFTKGSADLILKSCDEVEFRVHKVILAESSAFFENTFSLPQAYEVSSRENQIVQQEMSDGMPVILIPQHSTVLLNLLRLCYPVSDPTWSNLEDIRATLQAAIRYDMTEAAELVKVQLRMHIPTAPLRDYAIACHQNLEDVARAAAEEVRRQECQSSFVPELEDITAGQYNRLLQFCELNEFGDPTESFCYGNGPDVISKKRQGEPKEIIDAPTPFDMSNADVILRSADLMDFRVHTLIISMISPVLGELLATRSDCEERRCGLPITPLLEDGATLFNLLQLAYPVHESATGEATMGRIDQWAAIFAAARKYKMNGVAQTLLKRFTCLSEEDPLSAYFIACRFGLQEQAIEAARLDRGLLLQHDRSPEMERASAGIYFRLLDYQRHCIQAVNAVIRDQVWWTRKARSLGDSANPQCLSASSDNSDDQSPCWILAVARALRVLMPENGFRGNVRRASSSGILNFMIVFKKLQTPIPFCDSCASLEIARSVHEIWPLVEQDVDAIVSQVIMEWK